MTNESKLDDRAFDAIRKIAYDRWGLTFTANKKTIVENRIIGLRRRLGLTSIQGLIQAIQEAISPDLEKELFNVLSTNHTSFFREPTHFERLKAEILAPHKIEQSDPLRFWSAGCSSGCEPYTVSMLAEEVFGGSSEMDCRILATDLSSDVLEQARLGTYGKDVLVTTSEERRRRHFETHRVGSGEMFRVLPRIRSRVSFGRLNLLDSWPMKGPFDAILCRNVMIYFDVQTKQRIAARMRKLIKPGGYLFLSTSESLPAKELGFELVEVGAYRNV